MPIFGVTSKHRADTVLTDKYNLFDWVVRTKDSPLFWGRYLLENNKADTQEIEFLHKKNCRLALIFDDLTEFTVSKNNGEESAIKAIEAAEAFGVLKNLRIALFTEIGSDWSVNHNWMLGYAVALINGGYIPGFIGNTDSSMNFNFGRQCSHYAQAIHGIVKYYDTVYWATQSELNKEPKEWTPFCPSELKQSDIGLWTCGEKLYTFQAILPQKGFMPVMGCF